MNTDDDTLTITLLGTGIPNPDINAFGTSTLIEAGGERVMIDCGRGTVIRMAEMGFPVGFIDTLILSHYHSDHYAGVFDLLMTGTIQQPFAGRGGPLKIIGPPGVEDIAEGAWLATRPDREIRVADSEMIMANLSDRLMPLELNTAIMFLSIAMTLAITKTLSLRRKGLTFLFTKLQRQESLH